MLPIRDFLFSNTMLIHISWQDFAFYSETKSIQIKVNQTSILHHNRAILTTALKTMKIFTLSLEMPDIHFSYKFQRLLDKMIVIME